MATQTQFLNTVLDRLEKQISKTAILQDQIEREEKRASVWEERALKAERALREEEGHTRILEQDFEVLRGELHRLRLLALRGEKAQKLLVNVKELQPVIWNAEVKGWQCAWCDKVAGEMGGIVQHFDNCLWRQICVFLPSAEPDPYNGLGEQLLVPYPQEASVNGG